MNFLVVALLSLCLIGVAHPAFADYPDRPIELVVPYGAGGGNDMIARALAAVAPDYLGQPLIIRIRPGAGSVLGLSEVARSRPDGYTLALPGPHVLTSRHFQDVPVNLLEDFELIAGVTDWPMLLLVPGNSPFQTYEEFYEYVRANPGAITMGNAGALTVAHLPALLWEVLAEVEVTHIPFDGGGPLNQALQSGTVDAGIGVHTWAMPGLLDGRLRALAVAGDRRLPQLPDVPTFRELGLDINVTNIVSIAAPKGIPADRLAFLREAFAQLVQDPTYEALIQRLGDWVVYRNHEELYEVYSGMDQASAQVAEALRRAGAIQ